MPEAASSAPTSGGSHRRARPTTSPWRVQRIILAVVLAIGVSLVGLVAPTTQADAAIAIPAAAKHYPHLQYGRSGAAVKYLQQRLHVKPTSGWFGPITRRAVKKSQASHQLARTGQLSVSMWHALGVKYVKPAPKKKSPAPGSNAFYKKVLAEEVEIAGPLTLQVPVPHVEVRWPAEFGPVVRNRPRRVQDRRRRHGSNRSQRAGAHRRPVAASVAGRRIAT